MLREFGVSYVILGHSERRAYCDETDRTVNLKVQTALAQGLTPIVAVGETLDERKPADAPTNASSRKRAPRSKASTQRALGRVVDCLRTDLGDRHRAELRSGRGRPRDGAHSRLSRRPRERARFSTAAA